MEEPINWESVARLLAGALVRNAKTKQLAEEVGFLEAYPEVTACQAAAGLVIEKMADTSYDPVLFEGVRLSERCNVTRIRRMVRQTAPSEG